MSVIKIPRRKKVIVIENRVAPIFTDVFSYQNRTFEPVSEKKTIFFFIHPRI